MKLELKPSAGDMEIQDLTPQTTNLGERIVKNMRICGSGIYTYAMAEANLLHLTPVPEKHRNLKFINVFRPPEVLKANKDKFARVPIITGHHVLVNRDTAKDLVVGMVGDTINDEVDPNDKELYLYTTGTIVAGDGIDAYEKYGQLSVGYDPVMEWRDGVHNGVPYQAVLTGFNDVNHLLICKTARGGPQCMVMDSLDGLSPLERIIAAASTSGNGGKEMNLFTKIFGGNKKAVVGDEVVVSTLLQSIAAGADAAVQIPKIRTIMGDAVDAKLKGYLDELETGAKDADKKVLGDAINIVDKYCKELMGDEAKGTDEPTKDVKGAGDEEKKVVDVEHKDGGKQVTVKKDDDGKKEEVKVDHEADGNKKVEVTKSNGDSFDYNLLAQKTAAIIMAAQAKVAGDEKPVSGTVVLNGDSQSAENGMSSDDIMKAFN